MTAFHGEAGYTEVHAHRATGAIIRTPALTCRTAPPPNLKKLKHELEAVEGTEEAEEAEKAEEEAEVEVLSVGLSAKARGGHVTLTAQKAALRDKQGKAFAITNITVFGDWHRGRIDESSITAYLFGKGSTFLVPNRKKPASEAVLKPPAPFSGSGTFRRHPKKPPTWTGDLKIALPGLRAGAAGRARHPRVDVRGDRLRALRFPLRPESPSENGLGMRRIAPAFVAAALAAMVLLPGAASAKPGPGTTWTRTSARPGT
ncbi:MAG: hypothetical protein ACRDPE_13290 [Solirubrobacterales bacterium]